VEAKVVNIIYRGDYEYATVEYDAGGATISTHLNFYVENIRVGDTISLRVSRQDPYHFVDGRIFGWSPIIIISLLSAGFGILGVVFLRSHIRERSLRKWLLRHGTPVWANVEGVVPLYESVTVSGTQPMVLKASYGQMRFTSDTLDNADMMRIGEYVKVLVNPEDVDVYLIDIHDESPQYAGCGPQM